MNARTPSHGPVDTVACWMQQEYAADALRALTTLLEPRGVAVLPVKGFVSARTLYDDVAQRPMRDLDVRVRPGDFPLTLAALRRAGWALDWSCAALGSVSFTRRGLLVEVETTVGPPGLCALRVADMVARATWRTDGGFAWRAPELHDHAMQLCMNVYKDYLRSPAWAFEDLHRVVRQPSFDVARFVALARASGVVTAIGIVVAGLRDRAAASAQGAQALRAQEHDPIWEDVGRRLEATGQRRASAERVWTWARQPGVRRALSAVVAHAGADPVHRRILGATLGAAGVLAWKARRLA